MGLLDLIGQLDLKNGIALKIQQLKDAMELRRPIWERASYEKKKLWITSDKDPVMSLAWTIYKYLRKFFKEADDGT